MAISLKHMQGVQLKRNIMKCIIWIMLLLKGQFRASSWISEDRKTFHQLRSESPISRSNPLKKGLLMCKESWPNSHLHSMVLRPLHGRSASRSSCTPVTGLRGPPSPTGPSPVSLLSPLDASAIDVPFFYYYYSCFQESNISRAKMAYLWSCQASCAIEVPADLVRTAEQEFQ